MENITLEMMDEVKNRTGATYEEAKEALENSDSVIDAVIYVERKLSAGEDTAEEEEDDEIKYDVDNNETVEKLKNLIKKGNVNKIVIRRDEHELVTFPVNAGIVGGLIGVAAAPVSMVAAAIISYGAGISIDVVNSDGEVKTIFGK